MLLGDMKSGGTRHIVLVANNPEIAEAVKQELIAPPAEQRRASAAKSDWQVEAEIHQPRAMPSTSTPIPPTPSATTLRRQIYDGKIDGFLWLSDGDLADRKVVYSAKDVTDFGESIELRNAVHSALVKQPAGAKRHERRGGRERLLKPIDLDSIRIEKGKEGASGISVFLVSFTMVMLLYVNVLVYGFAVMRSIIEEKSSRILEVLLSSVTAKQLLAGKIIGVGAVGLTQTIIWLLVGLAFSLPGLAASHSMMSNVHIPMVGRRRLRRVLHPRLLPLLHDVCRAGRHGELRSGGAAGAVAGHAAHHLRHRAEHAGAAASQFASSPSGPRWCPSSRPS